jgi:hypothetical protein
LNAMDTLRLKHHVRVQDARFKHTWISDDDVLPRVQQAKFVEGRNYVVAKDGCRSGEVIDGNVLISFPDF